MQYIGRGRAYLNLAEKLNIVPGRDARGPYRTAYRWGGERPGVALPESEYREDATEESEEAPRRR